MVNFYLLQNNILHLQDKLLTHVPNPEHINPGCPQKKIAPNTSAITVKTHLLTRNTFNKPINTMC